MLHNLRLAVLFEDEGLEAQQFLSVCKEQPLAPRQRFFVGENAKGLCFFMPVYTCWVANNQNKSPKYEIVGKFPYAVD